MMFKPKSTKMCNFLGAVLFAQAFHARAAKAP